MILLSNGGGISADISSSHHISHSSIKSIFEHLEGPSFVYQPVFDMKVYDAVSNEGLMCEFVLWHIHVIYLAIFADFWLLMLILIF